MLRYKTETRPGLVALYDIRPGNGAGLYSYNPGARIGQLLSCVVASYLTLAGQSDISDNNKTASAR